jgi:hypothetical protein
MNEPPDSTKSKTKPNQNQFLLIGDNDDRTKEKFI